MLSPGRMTAGGGELSSKSGTPPAIVPMDHGLLRLPSPDDEPSGATYQVHWPEGPGVGVGIGVGVATGVGVGTGVGVAAGVGVGEGPAPTTVNVLLRAAT